MAGLNVKGKDKPPPPPPKPKRCTCNQCPTCGGSR